MEGHKKTPNNAGVTYFKWVPQTRMLLLNTCLDKQVWTAGHGKKGKLYQDVCTILQTIPNYEEEFETLTWRKCQAEFEGNLKAYKENKQSVPFRSGSAEDHLRWHDVMEEVCSLEAMHVETQAEVQSSTSVAVKRQQQDLKTAGEVVRTANYTKFVDAQRKKVKKPKIAPNKDVTLLDDSDSDAVSEVEKKVSPTDRLANALAMKLEADIAKENATQQQPLPDSAHAPVLTQSTVPSSKYMLSSFGIIKEIVELIGAVDAQLVDRYVEQLTAFGFETPQCKG